MFNFLQKRIFFNYTFLQIFIEISSCAWSLRATDILFTNTENPALFMLEALNLVKLCLRFFEHLYMLQYSDDCFLNGSPHGPDMNFKLIVFYISKMLIYLRWNKCLWTKNIPVFRSIQILDDQCANHYCNLLNWNTLAMQAKLFFSLGCPCRCCYLLVCQYV